MGEVEHLSPIQTTRQFGIAVRVVFELYVVARERTAGWLVVDKHPLGLKDGVAQLRDRW